jgi:hypothetical protein
MTSLSLAYDPDTQRVIVNDKVLEADSESSRLIFYIEDMVLKVDCDMDLPYCQSPREVAALKRVAVRDEKYFPQVIAHGKFADGNTWIMMERIFHLDRYITQKDIDIVHRLKTRYSIGDLSIGGYMVGVKLHSLQYRNWFINYKTDLPVIVDLGY